MICCVLFLAACRAKELKCHGSVRNTSSSFFFNFIFSSIISSLHSWGSVKKTDVLHYLYCQADFFLELEFVFVFLKEVFVSLKTIPCHQ